MTQQNHDETIEKFVGKDYEFGFQTKVDIEKFPKGLNEDIIRFISAKKDEPEWLLEWRLDAFKKWQAMEEPEWANVNYDKPDFQDIIYYAAPKPKKQLDSLDEVD